MEDDRKMRLIHRHYPKENTLNYMTGFKYSANDGKLLREINRASRRVFDKLRSADLESLNISEYNKNYLSKYLPNLSGSLEVYEYILFLSLKDSTPHLSDLVFIDYGGGSGLLSILAKELRLGTVIYNDIYDVSCNDAHMLARSLGNEADYYINGDMESVIDFLRQQNIHCNILASHDVIEHIYNIESFLGNLPLLSDGPTTVVMSSGANSPNPYIKRSLTKFHHQVEHFSRNKEYGHKERDCLESFLNARKDIILKHLKDKNINLSLTEIDQLSNRTRGLIESDIRSSIDKYIETGILPLALRHPTNTCDPYTGNWAERLMDLDWLKDILARNGFEADILNGHYITRHDNIAKRFIYNGLNLSINLLGDSGICISPFFVLYGKKKC